ncbi:hypothetical protein AB432_027800 [Brevibacillus brevis]|uniref:HAD family hydrolase n=1 Tax=Brevibacillus brevis TaxID=1393 RepID=A0A2Z4MQH5_BREBE|nr:HAD-IA family hydrolase [Brevibacillus brevis]AWX58611.1 hypothetical protein AB432_027800 [Brevibacillus brevis]
MDNYFHQIYPHNNLVEFSTLRLQAEDRTRQLIRLNNPSWQDVNLNEIYEYIRSEYNFPLDIVDKLKAKEIELEIQYTMRRESVYELYQMAKERNKKIIFVSDMYLPGTVIKDIVEKAGYCDYEKIYVSSEARLLKYTGDMFKYVTIDLEINPNSILHIGDNWESDKVMAEKAGWNAFFIAKTLDLLLNNLADKESGNSVKYFNEFRQEQWTSYEHNEYLGTRCMLATVANKLFDNPYISFNPDSDFNVDPYFVGYYALGMHTVGLCKWIVEDAVRKNYNTIHFLARDGYLPHKVYDVISKYYSNAPESNYLYVSRRSMLPYLLSSHNKYGLSSFVSIYSHTPRSILGLFSGVLKNDLKLENFEEKGVILSKNFSSEFEFKKYLDVLIKDGIDWEKTKKYNSNIKEYLSSVIKSNDATFDLGYSARLQTMMVNILGYPCNTYFVHTSKELSKIYSRRNDFEVKSFFELKPSVSGILREHLFAELGPSCIGYEEKSNNLIEPVFEDYYTNHINQLMIKTLQNAAIDFATDFMGCFKDHLSLINIKNHEVSLPLEMYIHSSKQSDRLLFMHSYSDDTVHSGKDKNSVLNWWNAETNKLRIQHLIPEMSEDHQAPPFYFLQYHSRILRIIFFTLFDRDTLKNKVKSRYLGKPLSYKVLSTSYRMLRGFKRMIFK